MTIKMNASLGRMSCVLLAALLCSICGSPAEVAAEPLRYSMPADTSSTASSSSQAAAAAAMGFISNPSIYTYTVANQFNTPNKSQQQQQQHSHYKLKTSFTNEGGSANTVYRNGASNRNFYYTNNNNNNNDDAFDTMAAGGGEYAFGSPESTAETVFAEGPANGGVPLGTAAPPTQPPPLATGCNFDRLAVYKVVLHTYWTRELFPKHYPDWRPSAQWTKSLGRTHDSSYALYHLGQQATAGVKQFAETGKSEILDSVSGEQQQQQQQQHQTTAGNSFTQSTQQHQQSQQQQPQQRPLERSVFDEFTVPAILNGAGRSEAKFFVDSNHSLVSLMTRIVPSPDWFIGVDSFQLCVGGSWIDTVTVELDPLDAGTDNGFTFTAPNWPTSPQGVIYRITSRYPAHPAGSFFYPKSKRLPPIATFQFIKLKEYELSEVFNFNEDDRKYEMVKTQTHLESEHNHVEMNNELSANIERERQNEISSSSSSQQQQSAVGGTAASSLAAGSTSTERDRIRSKLLAKMNPMYSGNNISTAQATNDNGVGAHQSAAIPKNDKNALMQNIVNTYRRSSSTGTSSSSRSTRRRRIKGGSRDCRVGHWSEWSPCSKSCGIGEMHRYRKVIKHGKRGGRPCPALQESKWCGTEKGCHNPASYFNWSNT